MQASPRCTLEKLRANRRRVRIGRLVERDLGVAGPSLLCLNAPSQTYDDETAHG
jgi:hypothetical protein